MDALNVEKCREMKEAPMAIRPIAEEELSDFLDFVDFPFDDFEDKVYHVLFRQSSAFFFR